MVYRNPGVFPQKTCIHNFYTANAELNREPCSVCRPCTVSGFHIPGMASEDLAARCDMRTLRYRRFHRVNLDVCERDLSQPCRFSLLCYSQKKGELTGVWLCNIPVEPCSSYISPLTASCNVHSSYAVGIFSAGAILACSDGTAYNTSRSSPRTFMRRFCILSSLPFHRSLSSL